MLDLSSVNHHPALEAIVEVLCNKTQQMDRGFFRAEVAYFLGKIASSMRATVVTKDRGEIPVNIYTLALATSGYGKGHSIGIIETEFLSGFKKRFMEDTFLMLSEQNLWVIANNRSARNSTDQNAEFEGAQKEWRGAGAYPFTFDSGTSPAVKQLRHKLLMSGAGSINLQIDEIGSNLIGNVEVLNVFLELYDQGLTKTKLIKNTADNSRNEEIDGKTPTNMLLFGTPSKLLDGGQTEDQFYSFLETGFARRCLFGYGHHKRASDTAEIIFQRLTQPANSAVISHWSNHFSQLADPAMFNWKMVVEDDVAIQLLSYKIDCEKRAEALAEHDEVKKAELSHRYFKALKLAGAYAFVDVSTEIEMSHLRSAIKLVEESGEAFFKLLNRDKVYVKLAKYIANCSEELTHADLTESLPFYPKGYGPRNDMMNLAIAWGYKKNIIIKKNFHDGIELFKGETLAETDLNKCRISYSDHWAYNYEKEEVPFEVLHMLTQHQGKHWSNHHFKGDHRAEENTIPGFNLVVIDVDEGISISTVHELMKDYKFMTYTTKRHTSDANRFRLILPINYYLKLDNEEYKEFMRSVFAWLPFKTDESSEKREKKWESFEGGSFHYNLEGNLLDALPFIPKTSRNETFKTQNKDLQSLDNLERWFAQRIANGNRNNQMIKYALALVDSGWDLHQVLSQVKSFNSKLNEPMSENEIDSTIAVTVSKRYLSVVA
jgi:hypothetical protein